VQPFRFGVQSATARDGRAWRERARRVEGLGYSALYVPDHLGDQFGPLVALTAAADATEHLRVGALVLDNDFRHPVVLAKELATLDLFSEGRLEVGLGAGWMRSDYDASGIPFDPPGLRISRLEESVAVMKALWSEGRATSAGRHYHVTRAQGWPRPHCSPHPPLIIGGGGRRVLSLAAREADVVGVNPTLTAGHVGPEVAASATAARFRERVGWVREAAGDRLDRLELQVLAFLAQVTPDRREVAERLGGLFGLSPDEALDVPIALVGTVDEICDSIVHRREEYGFNRWVVHDPEMEAFAPVVARLAGT